MATGKKDGGVRPLVAGQVLRRIAAKTLCEVVKKDAHADLWPLQVGVATKKRRQQPDVAANEQPGVKKSLSE